MQVNSRVFLKFQFEFFRKFKILLATWIRSLFAFSVMILYCTIGIADDSANAADSATPTQTTAPQKVIIGIYPMTVYDLNMASSTFYMDTYIWFRWKGDIDPVSSVEFANGVEGWSTLKVKVYEAPIKQPDGSLYQSMRVTGRFFQPFSLINFPLDHQILPIVLENSAYGIDQVVYELDNRDTGHSPHLKIPGWSINGWNSSVAVHKYDTRFGDDSAGDLSSYSQVRFNIEIQRPVNFFVFKLLLPLVIVLSATWIALLLPPRMVEARVAMPATVLLTAVFLQQSYTSTLPEVGHLVLLDKIYVIAYILILTSIALIIYLASHFDHQISEQLAITKKINKVAVFAQISIFMTGVAVVILTRAT